MTGVLLYLLAFKFAGGGVRELQEAGWISVTAAPIPDVPWLRDWFAIYPFVEPLARAGAAAARGASSAPSTPSRPGPVAKHRSAGSRPIVTRARGGARGGARRGRLPSSGWMRRSDPRPRSTRICPPSSPASAIRSRGAEAVAAGDALFRRELRDLSRRACRRSRPRVGRSRPRRRPTSGAASCSRSTATPTSTIASAPGSRARRCRRSMACSTRPSAGRSSPTCGASRPRRVGASLTAPRARFARDRRSLPLRARLRLV